jgi:hypothetical protein
MEDDEDFPYGDEDEDEDDDGEAYSTGGGGGQGGRRGGEGVTKEGGRGEMGVTGDAFRKDLFDRKTWLGGWMVWDGVSGWVDCWVSEDTSCQDLGTASEVHPPYIALPWDVIWWA